MGTDSWFLLLFPLITGIIIGFMLNWEIGIASGSLGAIAGFLIKASEPGSSPLWGVAGFIFVFIFFLSAGDSARRMLSNRAFRQLVECNLSELSTLRGDGVNLLNEGMLKKDATEIEKWWQEVKDWRQKVRSKMTEIHKSHPDNWEILGEVKPKKWIGVDDIKLNHYLSQLSMWQDRLWSYIDNRTRNINVKE